MSQPQRGIVTSASTSRSDALGCLIAINPSRRARSSTDTASVAPARATGGLSAQEILPQFVAFSPSRALFLQHGIN
jgi:hypothetical protein